MENLPVSTRNRLKNTLTHSFLKMPDEFISDAIGDAYTILLMKAPALVLENPAKKYRWLLKVASRRLSAQSKRLMRFVRNYDSVIDKFTIEPENTFCNSDTICVLMEYLSPLLRKTAELHFQKGFSYEEISEMLGENLETVMKRCKRAKKGMVSIALKFGITK